MVEARRFLEAGLLLHGHKCPAMPLGLRAGAAAMNRLGVERSGDKTLVALVELGDDHCSHCFADGIQMITGCTFGKGNIRQLGYGKFGVTLVDKKTGRAVRVVPRAEAQLATKKTPFFTQYRMKGVPPSRVPDEVVDPLIEKVMSVPEGDLLTVGEVFDSDTPLKNESFDAFVCEVCGEMVVESYGRIAGGQKVCIPCQQQLAAVK